LYLHNKGGVGL